MEHQERTKDTGCLASTAFEAKFVRAVPICEASHKERSNIWLVNLSRPLDGVTLVESIGFELNLSWARRNHMFL
jgi:hypothetical protein